jgi:hypothetical protein
VTPGPHRGSRRRAGARADPSRPSEPSPNIRPDSMRRRRITSACVALALLTACAAAAAPAGASSRQLTIFQDNDATIEGSSASRARRLDEIDALGVDVVKVNIPWRFVAPSRRPSDADAAKPSTYPRLGTFDQFVRRVKQRGMIPFLNITGPAPNYAAKSRQGIDGTHRPSARQFELFATAVGRRYSGVLRVEWWSLWNEPNLVSMLYPQRSPKRKIPLSPVIYRNLYFAGQRGLNASGHARDTILLGELNPAPDGTKTISTVKFLKEMGCLSPTWKPYRGAARRARGCPVNPAPITATGLAHHPYVGPKRGPRARPRGKGDVAIGYLSRLTRTINSLYARGRLASRQPVYITEFGFQTNPPDRFQNPIGRVPAFMDESEWIAYRNPRVRTYAHYQLLDAPLGPPSQGLKRYGGFQTGLRFASGKKKERIYRTFEMPFFVRLKSNGVGVLGTVRRAGPGTVVQIFQRPRRRGTSYKLLGTARIGANGYFLTGFKISSPSKRWYRAKYVTPSGTAMRRTKLAVKR